MLSDLLTQLLTRLKGDIALAFSYQAEDVVILDLLKPLPLHNLQVFTLDTGKLFAGTDAYHTAVETYFGITIQRYHPEPTALLELEDSFADEWGMRASLANRRRCCEVRKVTPLRQALVGKAAWITGQRAGQSVTRSNLAEVEFDTQFQLLKFNPLANWSEAEVMAYSEKQLLPLNPLYQKGYRSIGCAPCTRPIGSDDDIRAGRWWWENPEHKECGLHARSKQ